MYVDGPVEAVDRDADLDGPGVPLTLREPDGATIGGDPPARLRFPDPVTQWLSPTANTAANPALTATHHQACRGVRARDGRCGVS